MGNLTINSASPFPKTKILSRSIIVLLNLSAEKAPKEVFLEHIF